MDTAEAFLIHACIHVLMFPTQCSILKVKDRSWAAERLWWGCRRGSTVTWHCTRGKNQNLFLQHLTTSWPLIYVYMYMCMDCFQYTFRPKQTHSRWVQVHKETMSSTILVYVYGVFFFEVVLSYKGENCLQVEWEVHNSLAFFCCLKVTPFGELVYVTHWTWKSSFSACQVKCVYVSCPCGEPIALSYSWLWTSNVFGKSYWCSLLGEKFCWF